MTPIPSCPSISPKYSKDISKMDITSVFGPWIMDGWPGLTVGKISPFPNNFTTWGEGSIYGVIWSAFVMDKNLQTPLMHGNTWKIMSKQWHNCLTVSDWITATALNLMSLDTWSSRPELQILTSSSSHNYSPTTMNKKPYSSEVLESTPFSNKPNICYQAQLSPTVSTIPWVKGPHMSAGWIVIWRRGVMKL